MKYYKFKIKIYDWDIFYIEVESKKDAKKVVKKLESIGVPKDAMDDVGPAIKNNAQNGGEHFYNSGRRWSIILMYQASNNSRKFEIICHEKRHIEDRIMEHLGLEGTEAGAFIAGYIAMKLTPIIK